MTKAYAYDDLDLRLVDAMVTDGCPNDLPAEFTPNEEAQQMVTHASAKTTNPHSRVNSELAVDGELPRNPILAGVPGDCEKVT